MQILGYNFEGPFDPDKGFQGEIAAVYTILDNKPIVIDVGQTEDLNNRFPSHERMPCWRSNGTGRLALYIHQDNNEQSRLLKESQIRKHYNPPCGER